MKKNVIDKYKSFDNLVKKGRSKLISGGENNFRPYFNNEERKSINSLLKKEISDQKKKIKTLKRYPSIKAREEYIDLLKSKYKDTVILPRKKAFNEKVDKSIDIMFGNRKDPKLGKRYNFIEEYNKVKGYDSQIKFKSRSTYDVKHQLQLQARKSSKKMLKDYSYKGFRRLKQTNNLIERDNKNLRISFFDNVYKRIGQDVKNDFVSFLDEKLKHEHISEEDVIKTLIMRRTTSENVFEMEKLYKELENVDPGELRKYFLDSFENMDMTDLASVLDMMSLYNEEEDSFGDSDSAIKSGGSLLIKNKKQDVYNTIMAKVKKSKLHFYKNDKGEYKLYDFINDPTTLPEKGYYRVKNGEDDFGETIYGFSSLNNREQFFKELNNYILEDYYSMTGSLETRLKELKEQQDVRKRKSIKSGEIFKEDRIDVNAKFTPFKSNNNQLNAVLEMVKKRTKNAKLKLDPELKKLIDLSKER